MRHGKGGIQKARGDERGDATDQLTGDAHHRGEARSDAGDLEAGFLPLRSERSHRINPKGSRRVVQVHSGAALLPEIIKQVVEAIEESLD